MKKQIVLALIMSTFLLLSFMGTALATESKKIEAKIGWRSMDQKNLVLVKDGEILMRLELKPDVLVKVKEKEGSFKTGLLDDVLSGYDALVIYEEEGGTKTAKEINVTPVKAAEEE